MHTRLYQAARIGLILAVILFAGRVVAAPYAALVMDARTGQVLHSDNADTRLHPASLTKMMTLYIAFQAVERGEISLDTLVTVSSKAAAEEPSKLGLRKGQKIKLRFLIRAAAIKSANDAATAIGEAISGSEAAFARRMNRTAQAMGMTRTTFKNAHGLTEAGHLSTARDMSILGRHVLYDFPEYYNLFSRRSTHAGVAEVRNTNRRLLNDYRGADGIKTGYTRAAGFNLVASAERGTERVIATVFGGRSTTTRNAQVAKLLDLGFRKAPTRAALRRPSMKAVPGGGGSQGAGKTIRLVTAVKRSLRPQLRPVPEAPALLVAEADILAAVETAQATPAAAPAATPQLRPEPTGPVVVTRASTRGGKQWGINVGRFTTRHSAEKHLLKIALAEMSTLDGTLRKVVSGSRGFDANFLGMTRETADIACRRLQARGSQCFMMGPG